MKFEAIGYPEYTIRTKTGDEESMEDITRKFYKSLTEFCVITWDKWREGETHDSVSVAQEFTHIDDAE